MATPTNTKPAWKSYQETGNPVDMVKSTTVASAIGGKVDAVSGQTEELTIFSSAEISDASNPTLNLVNTGTTSKKATVNWGTWSAGVDLEGDGTNDYFINNSGLSSTPLTITHDGKVIPQWTCNTVNAKSAYDYVGSPVEISAYFGTSAAAPMAASAAGMQVVANVYNTQALPVSDTGYNTYSEFSAVYTFLQGFTKYNGVDCVHANEHYIGYDNHLVTPYTTTSADRPNNILGMSYLGQLLGVDSDVVDTDGNGSFLSSMVTVPITESQLDYYGAPTTASTQPFTALYYGGGFTGTSSITGGDQSGAGNAATYCFLAGNGGTGAGGSVYINAGARSKFKISAQLGDWTDAGLIIGNPIGTETSSGGRQYGIYNPYCTLIGGSLPDQTGGVALYVPPPTTETSRNVSISIGDAKSDGTTGYTITHDTGKTGGTDLAVWSNVAQKNILWVDGEKIGLNGSTPIAAPSFTGLASTASTSDIITAFNELLSFLGARGDIKFTGS